MLDRQRGEVSVGGEVRCRAPRIQERAEDGEVPPTESEHRPRCVLDPCRHLVERPCRQRCRVDAGVRRESDECQQRHPGEARAVIGGFTLRERAAAPPKDGRTSAAEGH